MQSPGDASVLTVSQLTRQIKRMLEQEFVEVWVSGEISNYVKHSSGHHYFTIKDDKAEMPCTLWKRTAAGINVSLKDGMKVLIFGDINVYELRGRYQLNVAWVIPEGVGQLEIRFRELKERLLKEGLFDESLKRPLPPYPNTIGIVTSPTGAAIRDMINVITRRMPSCRIILCPVAVQGPGAEAEIVDGIRMLNEYGDIDLMIVGRGGGSLEDLWAFNEEIVARAIRDSRIPIISAVGHEVDFTISDFAADLRAPTPSAAAELAVPDRAEVLNRLDAYEGRFGRALRSQLENKRTRLESASSSYFLRRPENIISNQKQLVDELSSRLSGALDLILERTVSGLSVLEEKLTALSPKGVLQRGYAVCRNYPDLTVIRDAGKIRPGETISIELWRGALRGTVDEVDSD